ncbi:MAG: hypothetical protein U1E16_04560 [Hyphomicrobiales bacterium]
MRIRFFSIAIASFQWSVSESSEPTQRMASDSAARVQKPSRAMIWPRHSGWSLGTAPLAGRRGDDRRLQLLGDLDGRLAGLQRTAAEDDQRLLRGIELGHRRGDLFRVGRGRFGRPRATQPSPAGSFSRSSGTSM